MSMCYSCLLSLVFLLFITNCTHTASLRSILHSSSKWSSVDRRHSSVIVDNQPTTAEPVLSRRRPLLPFSDRRRRWSNNGILIDETVVEQGTSTTIFDHETTVLTDKSDDIFLFNSTSNTDQSNAIDSLINFYENSTISETLHPLLRQGIIEINHTNELSTISPNGESPSNNNETGSEIKDNLTTADSILSTAISDAIFDINTTETKLLPTTVTDVNPVKINESVTDVVVDVTPTEATKINIETSSIPASINQTIVESTNSSEVELSTNSISTTIESKQDTAIILLDHTTITSITTTDDNQTSTVSETESIPEFNTTIIDENINTTVVINTTQNETTVIEQQINDTTVSLDVTQNDTLTTAIYENEYSNETVTFVSETIVESTCDLSCQCSKKCPYGFQLMNDTCECDPACQNYQCFGNDTCIVTNDGRPLCQPKNGTEHDRPTRCYQPQDAGHHDAGIRYYDRWYYTPDQDTCHSFVYRGLGGNENNFQTLNECRVECITCGPRPDPGECLARLSMWYYDYRKNQCARFDYSGCKGNENKFFQKQDCIDTCVTRILNL